MSSHGQRFRRRAVRRGYKVDEVDVFLDRVEATLNGAPIGTPVAAQEVHDVVFRVRFGGYDEWQVDLHLDRVERQLAELEETRTAQPGRGAELRAAMGGPMPGGGGHAPNGPMPPPLPVRTPAANAPTGALPRFDQQQRYDEPANAFAPQSSRVDPYGPPPPMQAPPMQAPQMQPPPPMQAPPMQQPPQRGGFDPDATGTFQRPVSPAPPQAPAFGGDAHRVDQLRRTFQTRRFGSGYDPAQVDRIFESVLSSLSGRGGPVPESELDPSRLNLVPGGYYEAEVDQALREVRALITRR